MAEGGGSRRARSLKINASFRDRGGAWPASRRCRRGREWAIFPCRSAWPFCGGGRRGPRKAKVVGPLNRPVARPDDRVAAALEKRRSLAPLVAHAGRARSPVATDLEKRRSLALGL